MREPDRGGFGWALAAVAFGWLVLGWPWLSGRLTIPYDAKAHFQPQLDFLAHALHSGQSPFWNPHVFAGSPQIADPQSLIFSPAIVLAALDPTPSFRAFDAYVLVLLLGGALAVAMLFRERSWHPAGAVVAALSFGFGASAAWRIQHVKQVQSLVFLAVSLWLLTRLLARARLRDGLLAGLAIGLIVVEPGQVALMGCYVLAGLVLHEWLSSETPVGTIRRTLPALVAAGMTAAAVAAVPVLMAHELVAASSRADIPFLEAARGSLHPASLLTFLLGDLYGAGSPHVPYWGPPSAGWDAGGLALAQNMTVIYAGALAAVGLIAFGVAGGAAWRKEARFYTLALGVSVLYAVGSYTPVFAWLYEAMPGVHLFRRPADATFIIGITLAITGGYAVHVAATEGAPEPRARKRVATLIVLLFLTGASIAVAMGHAGDAVRPLLVSALLTGIASAVLFRLKALLSASPAVALAAVTALTVADLGLVNGPNGAMGLPPSSFPMLAQPSREPTIEMLESRIAADPDKARRDRVELAGLGFEWPNAGMVHGFDHVLGYNPLRLSMVTEAVGADDTIAVPAQRRFTPLFPSYTSQLAAFLGLRYIATGVPVEEIDPTLDSGQLKLLARTETAFVYENPRALPRVMFADDWRRARFDRIMRTGLWPSFDPRTTVLLDIPAAAGKVAERAGSRPALLSTVALSRYENTRVDVEVEAADSGFVVLNDVWHPWWRATVDGNPAPIFKANVMFRAVAVPKGHHVVRFEFEPFAGAFQQLARRVHEVAEPIPSIPPRPEDVPVARAQSTPAATRHRF